MDTTIHLKLPKAVNDKFNDRAAKLGIKPSVMLRDIMLAFAEDRLTIQPLPEQLKLFGIDEE